MLHTYAGSIGAHTTHHIAIYMTVQSAPALNTRMMRGTGGPTQIFYLNQSNAIQFFDGTSFLSSGVAPITGTQLLEITLNGTTGVAQFYRDGVAIGSPARLHADHALWS